MKKKFFVFVFVLSLVVTSLAGCGNAATDTSSEKNEEVVMVDNGLDGTSIIQENSTEEILEEKPDDEVESPEPEKTDIVSDDVEDEAVEEAAEEPTPVTEETPVAEAAAEVVAKPVAESISAKVNGSHNVGDTLSAADFTITVNMSDGSKVKNPAGWTADKLVLDSENTVINVSYNGMNTTVTVKASPAAQPQAPAVAPVQETPVQQPQAPAGGRPASANGPVTQAAINDLFSYAAAKGWSLRNEELNSFGNIATYTFASKGGNEFSVGFEGGTPIAAWGWSGVAMNFSNLAFLYDYVDSVG